MPPLTPAPDPTPAQRDARSLEPEVRELKGVVVRLDRDEGFGYVHDLGSSAQYLFNWGTLDIDTASQVNVGNEVRFRIDADGIVKRLRLA